jgi:hypothetical protein
MARLVLQAATKRGHRVAIALQAFVDINWLYFSFLLFVFTGALIFR